MLFFNLIINGFEILFFAYFAIASVYVLVFAVGALFYRPPVLTEVTTFRRFAVLIPAYREDAVIIDSAIQALNHDYPVEKFDVIIIGDSLQEQTLQTLLATKAVVYELVSDESTKVEALKYALVRLPEQYDCALVLDADNVMQPGFLRSINEAFEAGFKVVQGHRIAKNLNTGVALLDAISEELNNTIFRKGHRALGMSSALIGSGMAFDYLLFKELMLPLCCVGGFDKELEMRILRSGTRIEYKVDALIADEKVQKVEVFRNQRRRWLSAQFVCLGRYFMSGLYHLVTRGNVDFFDKVYQMIIPPRVLLVGFTLVMTVVYFAVEWLFPQMNLLIITSLQWFVVALAVVIAYLLAIPSRFYNRSTFKALMKIPLMFFTMVELLFKLKGANDHFIHTEHGECVKGEVED